MLKNKIFILICFTILIFILFMYLTRFSYRNKDSVYGKVVNSFFNLNSVIINDCPNNIDIFWKTENGRQLIVKDSKITGTKFGNFFGINTFEVNKEGKKIGTFTIFNYDKKKSYDFIFKFSQRSIDLKIPSYKGEIIKEIN